MSVALDVAARYGAARMAVALSELDAVHLSEPARSRLAFLLNATRRDLTEAADQDDPPHSRIARADTQQAAATVVAYPPEIFGDNVIPFRPRTLAGTPAGRGR